MGDFENGGGDRVRPSSSSSLPASAGPADLDGAVQVIETNEEEHTFHLNEETLARILLDPRVADKKVAVVSVAGAFRKGKSFLLNFFLRYLQHKSAGESDGKASFLEGENWLGSENSRLRGFSWRGGSERATSGILVWKEPFLVSLPSGEEVAVLLMDTQGAFDSQSTVKDCATVFALSTMLSSVQIYNLSQNIQEDDLQHLQLFTEYGRLALEATDSKPFQSLLFLVRDWSFPYEAEYGFLGGQRILDKRLEVSGKQHPELQQLRRHIRSCFDSIGGFLMPHPGLKVATNPHFQGQLVEIEDEFKQQLRTLVPRVLNEDQLVLKKINGQQVLCRELLQYFKAYIKIFQGEELPEPKSMLLATAEANNLAAVASAKAHYCRSMEEVCGGETPYMALDDLSAEHERCREEALDHFRETRKMGGEEFSASFLDRLDDEIYEAYENFIKSNNSKNLFRSFRTPAVIFVLIVLDYVLQEIFQFVYLDVFATTCSTLMFLLLFTLIVWAYSRYSGSFREAAAAVDDGASWIWEHVLSPLSNTLMSEGVKHATSIQRKLSEAPGHQRGPRKPSHPPPAYPNQSRPRRYAGRKEE